MKRTISFAVNSTSSGSSTKFDPDLLKADVALAKNRVARLRRDLDVARAEFAYQQRGIDMLAQYARLFEKQKLCCDLANIYI